MSGDKYNSKSSKNLNSRNTDFSQSATSSSGKMQANQLSAVRGSSEGDDWQRFGNAKTQNSETTLGGGSSSKERYASSDWCKPNKTETNTDSNAEDETDTQVEYPHRSKKRRVSKSLSLLDWQHEDLELKRERMKLSLQNDAIKFEKRQEGANSKKNAFTINEILSASKVMSVMRVRQPIEKGERSNAKAKTPPLKLNVKKEKRTAKNTKNPTVKKPTSNRRGRPPKILNYQAKNTSGLHHGPYLREILPGNFKSYPERMNVFEPAESSQLSDVSSSEDEDWQTLEIDNAENFSAQDNSAKARYPVCCLFSTSENVSNNDNNKQVISKILLDTEPYWKVVSNANTTGVTSGSVSDMQTELEVPNVKDRALSVFQPNSNPQNNLNENTPQNFLKTISSFENISEWSVTSQTLKERRHINKEETASILWEQAQATTNTKVSSSTQWEYEYNAGGQTMANDDSFDQNSSDGEMSVDNLQIYDPDEEPEIVSSENVYASSFCSVVYDGPDGPPISTPPVGTDPEEFLMIKKFGENDSSNTIQKNAVFINWLL